MAIMEEKRNLTITDPVDHCNKLESAKQTERVYWNKAFKNMQEALIGNAQESVDLNLLYMEVRAERIEIEGDFKEARRLRNFVESIRRERE